MGLVYFGQTLFLQKCLIQYADKNFEEGGICSSNRNWRIGSCIPIVQ